jgi:demethylmenaquinone methyltransferase/2-methoxy-6-polyprenyl-1,4-benzoquinol methylase
MKKRTRFEGIARYYDFFTKLLMMGTYGRVRDKIVASCNGGVALDLCCGTGYVTGYIRARRVVGLDLTPGMLRVNRSKNLGNKRVALIQGDAYNLPFKKDSFDAVYFTLASHEFRNLMPILRGAYEVLRKGGEIIIYDIFKPSNFLLKGYMFFVKHVVEFGKCWLYDLEEWQAMLRSVGFRDVEGEVLYKASLLLKGRKGG